MPTNREMPSPELSNSIAQLRAILCERMDVIRDVIGVLIAHPSCASLRQESTPIPDAVVHVLPLMLQALGSSTNTIVRLSDVPGLQTRDCYSIARSIVELAVNICYIISQGPDLAERAIRHARQKVYRDLERESHIGQQVIRLELSGYRESSDAAEVKQEISEFTSRQGREKGWVDLSVDERIEAAGRELGNSVLTALHFARFMIYRHSSEILHGTFFSTLYFFGLSQVPQPENSTECLENIAEQHFMLLMAVGLSLSAVTEGFHLRYGFRVAYEHSLAITKAMREIAFFKRGLTDESSQGPGTRKSRQIGG